MIQSSPLAWLCLGAALLPHALSADIVSVTVTDTSARDRVTQPLVNGFNMEWNGIQRAPFPSSNLWDGTKIRQDLITFLENDFAGAVYRYPGGMGRVFEWQKSVGPISERAPQYNSTDHQHHVVRFGFNEAMTFVEKVGGTLLPVMNIYWFGGAAPNDIADTKDEWETLMKRQVAWLEYANAPVDVDWDKDGTAQGTRRKNHGREAPYNITTWELGNELDDNGTMSSETYITRCEALMGAMNALQSGLKFIVSGRTAPWGPKPLRDPQPPLSFGASAPSWRDWHNALLERLGERVWAIGMHPYYYDDNIDHIESYVTRLATDSASWATRKGKTAPNVVITEHAKHTESGSPETYYKHLSTTGMRYYVAKYPLPSDLPYPGGAISVADYAIRHHRTPTTRMLINHELAGQGPWALFSEVDANGYVINDKFAPRPLAYAVKLVNRISKTADVLNTSCSSPPAPAPSLYNVPAVNALGYKNGTSGIQGAFMMNRANVDHTLNLTLPNWASGPQVVRIDAIGGHDSTKLWRRYVATEVASNKGTLKLPGFSVFNAVALGANMALNGDFEQGSIGAADQPSWRKDSATSGSVALFGDPAGSINGSKIMRLQSTTSAGRTLVQPAWVNNALNKTGVMGQYPHDSYVLRANVRTSNTAAGQVKLRMQVFSEAGYVAASPNKAAPGPHGTWTPLELEFVPSALAGGSTFRYADIMLENLSPTGFADFDGITLFRRKNTAVNPNLLPATSSALLPDRWAGRGSGGTVQYDGDPKYVRLRRTASAGDNQFYQSHLTGSPLADRLGEKWRLRARVRHDGLSTSGAHLKVQLFSKEKGFVDASPVGPKLIGDSAPDGSWSETVLEFYPRQLLGALNFSYAEIMLQNNSTAGYVEVSFMSLEAVD